MQDSICYLNGDLGPLAAATVSVLDRGFIFGEGVYELIPVFNGTPFRLTEHLRRLRRSLAAVVIVDPFSQEQWTSMIQELIRANHGGDQAIYIQITRGAAARNHVLTENIPPTVFAMSSPPPSSAETIPIEAITTEDIRWQRCDIKATSLLANVMSRALAADSGSQEAIYIREGYVTEGAASNVFISTDGHIKTPPISPRILPGVTRDLLVELLEHTGTPVHEESISIQQLIDADEAWVTSSSREMVPVVRIDRDPVGDGEIGPVFRHVQRIYREYKAKVSGRS